MIMRLSILKHNQLRSMIKIILLVLNQKRKALTLESEINLAISHQKMIISKDPSQREECK